MFPRKLTKAVISAPDYPVVQTRQGRVRGLVVEDTFIFRGIRYARARRFRMPEEPEHWEGIRDAVVYGPACPEISTLLPPDDYVDPHAVWPQSEDCLRLNLWTQHIDPTAKRPVMVWLHGGGFEHGSAIEIFSYDGEELSKFGDVVVVSLNHRLHALGYMDLSDYGEEYRYSGSHGNADIIAALRWIRENIAAFGGDPDRVTLFGQSGGGKKIGSLLQTPAADGLYHRASIQSAGSVDDDLHRADAAVMTGYVLDALGLGPGNIHEIDTMPYHKLAYGLATARVKYVTEQGKRMIWTPVIDGDYYLGLGTAAGHRKETLNVPLLVGTVLGEMSGNGLAPGTRNKQSWSSERVGDTLRQRFGDNAGAIVKAYRKAYPERPAVDACFTDAFLRAYHINIARSRAAAGAAPAYNWVLALEMPAYGGSTPWHNAEEPFVFHNARYLESVYRPAVTDRLENLMCGAWVRFAESGDPNLPGLPNWKSCEADRTHTMIFDDTCRLATDHDQEYIELVKQCNVEDISRRGPRITYGGGPRAKEG